MRGFKTLAEASVLCRMHAFLRHLRGQLHDLGRVSAATTAPPGPLALRAWDALTADLLGQ